MLTMQRVLGLLASTHVFRHVLKGVKHSVHGEDVSELHKLSVGQLAGLVKLALAVAGLKDVERRHLRGVCVCVCVCFECVCVCVFFL